MALAIEIKGVSKTLGTHLAVDRLDLAVNGGQIFGFIGPNGSGKTTTIRMILRMIQPDQGVVSVLGKPAGDAADDRIGYLPEERGLYRNMKAFDLLYFFGKLKRGTGLRPRIEDWLERMGLGAWRDKPLDSFSKGMAQKIQFIAAVIADPELVILDEPFSGLDPINAELLKREVLHLRDLGKTVIFSTHDMASAESICDSIFMIYQGRKVLDGTVKAIKEHHATKVVYMSCSVDRADLTALPGAQTIDQIDGQWKIQLQETTTAEAFLKEALMRFPIQKFEVGGTSLRDIFLTKAQYRVPSDG